MRASDKGLLLGGQPHQAPFDFNDTSIVDRGGLPVDVTGWVWVLNDPTNRLKLDWQDVQAPSREIQWAFRLYFIHLIKNYSTGEVKGNWGALQFLLKSASFREACQSGNDIPYRAISETRESMVKHETYRLHYVRKFYNWCCDQGLDGFSPEVAIQINELVIGGNKKGEAVQALDPDEGPLLDVEAVALNNALRSARATGSLSLKEQGILWVCSAFGCNAGPLTLLRDEDFEKLSTDDAEGVVYQLRIPRHKKGKALPRTSFRVRRLNAEIGSLLESLIHENRLMTPEHIYNSHGAPLFRRDKPRKDIEPDSPIQEYRYHHAVQEMSTLLGSMMSKLKIMSPRNGNPLHVTVRRLRYTFATRLVREGASQAVVADALDHSDLQNVQVYFDLKSDIVRKLDAAMAMELGPLSQAFLGQIIRNEKDAVGGGGPSRQVFFSDRKTNTFKSVGNCGSFSFCGLSAPLACYTCTRFQAWTDGPHDKALGGLLDRRQRRLDEGMDGKIVALNDNTILAIADLIGRIDVIRKKKQHG